MIHGPFVRNPVETTATQGVVDLATPSVIPEADETVYLLGTAATLGFVVARYVILSGKISPIFLAP